MDPYLLFYIPVFIGLGLAFLALLSANGRDGE